MKSNLASLKSTTEQKTSYAGSRVGSAPKARPPAPSLADTSDSGFGGSASTRPKLSKIVEDDGEDKLSLRSQASSKGSGDRPDGKERRSSSKDDSSVTEQPAAPTVGLLKKSKTDSVRGSASSLNSQRSVRFNLDEPAAPLATHELPANDGHTPDRDPGDGAEMLEEPAAGPPPISSPDSQYPILSHMMLLHGDGASSVVQPPYYTDYPDQQDNYVDEDEEDYENAEEEQYRAAMAMQAMRAVQDGACDVFSCNFGGKGNRLAEYSRVLGVMEPLRSRAFICEV